MLPVAFDLEATSLEDPSVAGQVLAQIGRTVPTRNCRATVALPADIETITLSRARLEATHRKEGAIEFATLGSGNHFIEFQADEDGRLGLMLHSGVTGDWPGDSRPPRERMALLIGAVKTDKRFYQRYTPVAEKMWIFENDGG